MTTRPKPKSTFRRIERWFVGIVMGVLAFGLERAVLRSIKKGGTKPVAESSTVATSSGKELKLD